MMDFCAVGSVKDYMKKSGQTLTENQVAAVLHYVCEGLAFLHNEKIVHRYGAIHTYTSASPRWLLSFSCLMRNLHETSDLKSANILINDVGDIKIGMTASYSPGACV